jgi:arginine decarboxylase
MAKTSAPRLDHFFSAVAARLDLWRDVSRAAQAWGANQASRGNASLQAACNEALTALLPLEDFQAYPGARVLNAIKQRVAGGDAMGTARLVQRVSSALMSKSYRSDAGEFEAEDEGATPERAMPAAKTEGAARPYFEVLFVTPTPPSHWPAHIQQIRKLRRPEDEFVYEPVFVGSFEDAALAVILNTNLESVVIYDGFPYESSRDVPLLKSLLSSRLSAELKDRAAGADGVTLAKLVKGFRPDLDIILLA